MAKKEHIDASLIGKIEQLTPAELEDVAAQIEARRKAVREQMEKEALDKIAIAAKEAAQVIGWTKLPKLMLTLNETGDSYNVGFATNKVSRTAIETGRAKSEVNGGDITIKKIGTAMGGIVQFKDKDGNKYDNLQDLVKALKQPDGNPEADRCWDIQHKLGVNKGISASDIVTRYHAEEVTLVFNNGTEKLVKDAVEEMKKARSAA